MSHTCQGYDVYKKVNVSHIENSSIWGILTMEMQLDKQLLIWERQQRAWSQSQLAEATGLSLRTVQRIEKTVNASLESAKALASVYGMQVSLLYAQTDTELQKPEQEQSSKRQDPLMTLGARNLALTLFLVSSLVMLLLVWTGIGPRWINDLRDTVFSAQLSESTLSAISSIITLILTFAISCSVGVLFDAMRSKGLYSLIGAEARSGRFSLKHAYQWVSSRLLSMSRAMIRPAIVASAVLLVSGCGIYLTMEDYQKQNLSRFIQNAYSSSQG